jgi:hypothetical protein
MREEYEQLIGKAKDLLEFLTIIKGHIENYDDIPPYALIRAIAALEYLLHVLRDDC